MHSTEVNQDNILSLTKYAVEATDMELHTLWKAYNYNTTTQKVITNAPWEQLQFGSLKTIGILDERPICLSIRYYKIHGQLVMFWEATSVVVDHVQIDAWLEKNCYGGNGFETSCANNFHTLNHELEQLKHD